MIWQGLDGAGAALLTENDRRGGKGDRRDSNP
jgi:hypothetical protein